MSRMIDLIRASAVPSNLMSAAAKGALSVPAEDMVEILVYLANHNKVFGEQARLTLAGWDEGSARKVVSDPNTPKEVLDYFASPQNLRTPLLPSLLENSAIGEESLVELATSISREVVEAMLKSSRVDNSPNVLNALSSNPHLTGVETDSIRNRLGIAAPAEQVSTPRSSDTEKSAGGAPPEADGTDDVLDEALTGYLTEHASEIAADPNKPFQPIGGFHDTLDLHELDEPEAPAAAPSPAAAAKGHPPKKKSFIAPGERRGSALQKISQLDIKGRIQLAMKGSKEDRSILVRDGTKVVALAVLDSPKISDSEVESFASQKNVLETLLRGIPLKRRFAKNYNVVRNLCFNPRTPLDASLGLMKNLLARDLKNLSESKEVSDTIRKTAMRMFRQKQDPNKKT